MIEWIAETIEWFRGHPQYQLIIKSHPGEQNPAIPETKERVEVALKQRGIKLPDNVALLSPKASIIIYQLFNLATVGLVHTTTVGIEMVAHGIPVITSGRSPYRGFGFTVDPEDRGEYFVVLEKKLRGETILDVNNTKDLAYKFILFYHYHFYTKIDIMDYKWGDAPQLKVKSLDDILPGHNKFLDYIADSVMGGLPILSNDRWPEES